MALREANTAGVIVADHLVVCGGCAAVKASLGPGMREARYEMEKCGWVRIKGRGWVCPYCASKSS